MSDNQPKNQPITTTPIETRITTQGQAGIIMAQVCDSGSLGHGVLKMNRTADRIEEFPEITAIGYRYQYSVNNFKGDGSNGIYRSELVSDEDLPVFMKKYEGWNIHCYGEKFCVSVTMSRRAWITLDDMEAEGITGSLYYA